MNTEHLIVPKLPTPAKVTLLTTSESLKKTLLANAAVVTQVTNQDELQLATTRSQAIKALLDEVESTRKAVKAPFINIGKLIDTTAETFCQQLELERNRIKGLTNAFLLAEDQRVQRENERIAEEQRKAAQAAADALAEQERLANKSRVTARQEVAAEIKVQTAMENLQATQTIAPATITRAAGLTIKKEVQFEITDAHALYQSRPEFFDLVPKRSVIKMAITKTTVLPGLKVWEAINSSTR
jgi:hypothetical protein